MPLFVLDGKHLTPDACAIVTLMHEITLRTEIFRIAGISQIAFLA
jgi:hypothetical protein